MVCQGESCCYGARITNVGSMKIVGTNGLSFAVIDDVLKMEIEGTNESPFSVYCSKTQTCTIDCQSKNACNQMLLFCDGLCFVRCDNLRSTYVMQNI